MRFYIFPVLASLLAMGGCGTLVVHKAKPAGDFTGIPFYVKTAGCKHQVVRLEPYFVLTLTAKQGDKVLSVESTTLSFSQFTSKDVTDLRSALAGKEVPAGADIPSLWNKVRGTHYEPHIPESKMDPRDWFVVSDVVSAYTYVDYEHPYTLNSRRPIIGSAQVSAKLAADGTLSEASAQVEDKTLSTLLGLVPTADLIKSAAGVTKLDVGNVSTLELAIQEKGVKYTRTYLLKDVSPPCAVSSDRRREPSTDAERNANPYDLTIEEVGAEKKEADDNTIKVNGSVQLPKAKDSKPKP